MSPATAGSPADQERAREVARCYIAAQAPRPNLAPEEIPVAQIACERLFADLSRWVGSTGADALFRRALTETSSEHPFLSAVRMDTDGAPIMRGVNEVVADQGVDVLGDALESLLASVVMLLSRLIGFDLVERITQHQNSFRSNDSK